MKQTRKPQATEISELPLQAAEAALLERFRRLKDKQKSFVLRSVDLLLMNESARPNRKAEHAMIAVKWRAQGGSPFKSMEQASGIWENPTGMRFDIAEASDRISVEEADVPG